MTATNIVTDGTTSSSRRMTPKMWLLRSEQKAANDSKAFLAKYKNFLIETLGGETKDLIDMVESGDLLPTPTLTTIKHNMLKYMLEKQRQELEDSLNKPITENKVWKAIVKNADGSVALDDEGEPLEKGFDLNNDATRWLCRQIVEYSAGTNGDVIFTPANLSVNYDWMKASDYIKKKKASPYMHVNKTRVPSKGNPWMKAPQRQRRTG